MNKSIGLRALEDLINSALELDPATSEQLIALKGKTLLLHSPVPGIRVYLQPSDDGVNLSTDFPEAPDVTLEATPLVMVRLLAEADSSELISSGQARITGDLVLAARFQGILASLDMDWEAGLARLFGDIPAHLVGSGLRTALRWGRGIHGSLSESLTEYLYEELRLLPSRMELEKFREEAEKLRQDCDKSAIRLKELQQTTTPVAACLDSR